MLVLLVVLTSISCARRQRAGIERETKVKNYVIASDQIAEDYMPLDYITSDNCQSIYEDSFSMMFESFYLGQYLAYEFNISPYLSGQRLRKFPYSPFKKILHNRHEQIILFQGKIGRKVVSSGEKISFCRENDFYSKMTIQGAALNAYRFSSKLYKIATEVLKGKVKPISLNVSPLIEKQVHKLDDNNQLHIKRFFQVDNATYAYYGDGSGSMNLLPRGKSEISQKRFGGVPLWSIPMVPAHEYGHHLFLSLFYGRLIEQDSLRMNSSYHSSCFTQKKLKASSVDVPDKLKKYYRILDAYNEGFADLLGSLSLTKQERTLTGIRGLDDSREIESFVYDNREKKIFSETVYKKYINQDKMTSKGYRQPYSNPHTIGAILSYNFNQQLAKYGLEERERVEFSLRWLKQLNREIPSVSSFSNQSALTFAKTIYNSFIQYLLSEYPFQPELLKNICQIGQKNLPVLHPIDSCENTRHE